MPLGSTSSWHENGASSPLRSWKEKKIRQHRHRLQASSPMTPDKRGGLGHPSKTSSAAVEARGQGKPGPRSGLFSCCDCRPRQAASGAADSPETKAASERFTMLLAADPARLQNGCLAVAGETERKGKNRGWLGLMRIQPHSVRPTDHSERQGRPRGRPCPSSSPSSSTCHHVAAPGGHRE